MELHSLIAVLDWVIVIDSHTIRTIIEWIIIVAGTLFGLWALLIVGYDIHDGVIEYFEKRKRMRYETVLEAALSYLGEKYYGLWSSPEKEYE